MYMKTIFSGYRISLYRALPVTCRYRDNETMESKFCFGQTTCQFLAPLVWSCALPLKLQLDKFFLIKDEKSTARRSKLKVCVTSFDPEWACSGFFIPPLVTLHLNVQCLHDSGTKVKPFRIEFAAGSRSGLKLSIQCEILSRNHINGDRSSFRNETGSHPSQRTRSLIFLWFSADLLRALYLVGLCSNTSSFRNTFM